jgi:hypothetical protein
MAPSIEQTRVGIKHDQLLESAFERREWRRDVTSTVKDSVEQGSGAYDGSLQGIIRAPFPQTNGLLSRVG